MIRLRARLERFLSPGFSFCFRCERPWRFVEGHVTNYTTTCGCFPLCEDCWQALTVDERLPYYDRLCDGWRASSTDRDQIRTAVLDGR